jgi:prepilin-type processing-associated H-X9-DG protein
MNSLKRMEIGVLNTVDVSFCDGHASASKMLSAPPSIDEVRLGVPSEFGPWYIIEFPA